MIKIPASPRLSIVPYASKSHQYFIPPCRRRFLNTTSQISRPSTNRSTAVRRRLLVAGSILGLAAVYAIAHIYNLGNMSSKLIPRSPADVMVIREITPNVVTCSIPFLRMGTIRIGGRGTIIRLTSGALAVFCPVALTPDVKAKVAEMGGNVGYLIAGDFEHHIFLSEWAKEYPGAKLIGPEGLPEKRAGMKDEKIGKEPFHFVFTPYNVDPKNISDEFAVDFDLEYVPTHPNKEIVLFYKPDRVLIEADLMFNLPAIEQYSKVPNPQKEGNNLATKLFESLQSTSGDAKGNKRAQWYMFSAGNRKGYSDSVKRINAWDFTTLIPCHGETIEGNGKEVFQKVFEWHIQGHK